MAPSKYVVVEQAGYVGEREVFESTSWLEVTRWVERRYKPDEVEDLHVNIRMEFPNGTVEFM